MWGEGKAWVMERAKERGCQVTAFKNGVEGYECGELLRENDVCSAIWAEW